MAESRIRSMQWCILVVGSLVVLLADFGPYLAIPAQTKLLEDIICQRYYASQGLPLGHENDCKIPHVQSELAVINGWKDTFDALPSILVSVPVGVWADSLGRKPCVLVCFLGVFLGEAWARLICSLVAYVFPLRLIWLSGLFRMIGGGDLVGVSIVCVMAADMFPDAERATALFRLSSVAILADILATPLSATLMSLKSAWLPYILGLIILALGLLLGFLLPETLHASSADEAARSADATRLSSETPLKGVYYKARGLFRSTRFIWRNWNIVLALLMFLATRLSRQATALLLQYSSTKFNWSIARASFLLSLRGSVTMANFLLLMPALSSILMGRLHMNSMHKDRLMCQGSGCIAVLGFGLMFVSASPSAYIAGLVLVSLGSAFVINARSLVTCLVASHQVGTLYSATATVQSAGAIVAGPLSAQLFHWGLSLGWAWIGLPFLLAGLLYVLATLAVSVVSWPEDSSDERRPLLES